MTRLLWSSGGWQGFRLCNSRISFSLRAALAYHLQCRGYRDMAADSEAAHGVNIAVTAIFEA
jgi:hypothetical protein